jgi:SAM-dependent methyltransferase
MDVMSQHTFELTATEAAAYETLFVPHFFAQWVPFLLDAVDLAPGHRMLDVGCGTGVVAREALSRVGSSGSVVGLDRNDAMLDVARDVAPSIEWVRGDAADLPFPDAGFDRVVSQMAMMFFPDPRAALAEMRRTVRPGGRVAVLVPGALASNPPYEIFVDVVHRHAGAEARQLVSTYFALGDIYRLHAAFTDAGLRVVHFSRPTGWNRNTSIEAAITFEIDATPLGGWLTDAARATILADCERLMAPWSTSRGLECPFSCTLTVAEPTPR